MPDSQIALDWRLLVLMFLLHMFLLHNMINIISRNREFQQERTHFISSGSKFATSGPFNDISAKAQATGTFPDGPAAQQPPPKLVKKTIRQILSHAYKSMDNGLVLIHLSQKEYEILRNFAGHDKEDVLTESEFISEKALAKPSSSRSDEFTWFQEMLTNLIMGVLIAIALFSYVIYKLLRARFTWWSILMYVIFVMWVLDFSAKYLEIMKTERVLPPECDLKKMTWGTYIKTYMDPDHPCNIYNKLLHRSLLKYFVPPLRIVNQQFTTTIESVGEAFGRFENAIFAALPWILNLILFPVTLVHLTIIIVIILVFVTLLKSRFSIKLFNFFTLKRKGVEVNKKANEEANEQDQTTETGHYCQCRQFRPQQ